MYVGEAEAHSSCWMSVTVSSVILALNLYHVHTLTTFKTMAPQRLIQHPGSSLQMV